MGGVKHANALRNVLQGCIEFLLLLPYYIFRLDLGRYVLVGYHPSAVRNGLTYDGDETAVGQGHRRAFRISFLHRGGEIGDIFLRIDRKKRSGRDALLDEVANRASGFNDVR